MSIQKNKLKEFLVSLPRDTSELKREIRDKGVPRSTLAYYLNNTTADINGTHVMAICAVCDCKPSEFVVENSTEKPSKTAKDFQLGK